MINTLIKEITSKAENQKAIILKKKKKEIKLHFLPYHFLPPANMADYH